MPQRRQLAVALAALALLGAAPEDAVPLDAAEVKRRWHARLDARHFAARIDLEMQLAGLEETRELRVWRDDTGHAQERVMVRFESPPDLRNVRRSGASAACPRLSPATTCTGSTSSSWASASRRPSPRGSSR
jgi:hypothetical protein